MAVTDKTIVLITGANQGIGAAVATRLAKEHNYHVIIGSRALENGQKLADDLKSQGFSAESIQLDITSDSSIAATTTYLTSTYGHLDVLINNAGILLDGTNLPLRKLFDTTLSTNVTGSACLTESLLPLLRNSAQRPRLIFVSSAMGSLAHSLNPSVPWYNGEYKAYDASKAGVNILTANYARILADKEARVNSVCPGLVKTNLTGYVAYGHSPEIGAQRIVELATLTGKDSDVTGTFSDKDGPVPW
ncbi:Short-chain dehydrogenase/reductase [Lachnellula hyalina]|uniref:Short-chain dehydrogenase/reductase n=1 Tax=Lachnellula hyalina TaxID=1316788 RepID=A0A8H8TZB8_9HELO|nr:Short-chain dehydrogenase/reductase [Lachnellula hyalina]TVY25657.1 Short-chain dehydrogenase/reductase [Lachnellula hyalina]